MSDISSFAPERVHAKLLRAVFEHRMLSTDQITRLLYKPGMITTVRPRLRTLVEEGYLLRHKRPTRDIGQKTNFFSLAREGINYFAEDGIDMYKRYRPIEQKELSDSFVMHLLALNDVLIATRRLPDHISNLRVAHWYHEQVVEEISTTFSSKLANEEATEEIIEIGVKPDGWFDFRLSRPGRKPIQWCFWIELDRGTEYGTAFKKKIRGILHVLETGAYHRVFDTWHATILFPTTAGQDRVEAMQKHTRDVMKITHEKGNISKMFLFTALPMNPEDIDLVAPIDPLSLFTSPIWYRPFDENNQVPAIDLKAHL